MAFGKMTLVLFFALSLNHGLSVAAADYELDVQDVIARHVAALEQIKMIQLKCDVAYLERLDNTRQFKPMASVQWFRSGLQERHVERGYAYTQAEQQGGKLVEKFFDQKDPTVQTWGFTATEMRVLSGWDPDNPMQLPLEPGGARAGDFAKVQGSIQPRDPLTPYRRTPFWLLLTVNSYFSLRELSEVEDISVQLADQPEASGQKVIEFRRRKEGDGRMPALLRCWLSPQAGWLISRIEEFDDRQQRTRVSEVIEFAEPAPGIYFPVHVQWGSPDQDYQLNVQVSDLQINEPSDEQLLVVEFPEGSRVTEILRRGSPPTLETLGMHVDEMQFHIWGRGKPEFTFENAEDLRSWTVSAAAGSRFAPGYRPREASSDGINWFLIAVNGATILVIIALIVLRRRLA